MVTIERTKDSIQSFIVLLANILVAYVKAIASLFKPYSRKSIRGQNVLITGAAHGLGREMALKFASEGANLVLVDINEAKTVKDEICNQQNNNIKVISYVIDIRREREVAKLAQMIRRDLKKDIDILVNNAGVVQCLPILDLSPEVVERTFQVNTMAHIWTIQHFLPGMIEKRRGHIVAISSIAGIIGSKYLTDYCASKFAVVGLMEALDKEIHSKLNKGCNNDIHLTTICPSSMATGMFRTFTSRLDWLVPILKPDETAKIIVDSILENRKMVFIPRMTLILHKLSSLVPTEVANLVQEFLDIGVKPHL